MPVFVVQEHHASTLHYDFRLEKNGVLKSWAVPKGVPVTKGVKHLAVAVDDHELAYAGFEGDIPEGEYGAGKVMIWDSGSYEEESWGSDKIVFQLEGKKVQGRFCLIRFKKAGERQWLIFAL
jgi:bifunctional non-homologous end joining protein LigD